MKRGHQQHAGAEDVEDQKKKKAVRRNMEAVSQVSDSAI